ncbi:hypothetical protein C943_00586 [Mariniradius saccharolyticus AK6]|uniref:Uncharacterized protein n=1 Tax=Mariniradius saccharolyticus AK6 TaxID=1239962 RepID=M7XFK0_9BACT|nr:hypothetical protein C943_00586 [Mariniradius saccharolyticus AK6]
MVRYRLSNFQANSQNLNSFTAIISTKNDEYVNFEIFF